MNITKPLIIIAIAATIALIVVLVSKMHELENRIDFLECSQKYNYDACVDMFRYRDFIR